MPRTARSLAVTTALALSLVGAALPATSYAAPAPTGGAGGSAGDELDSLDVFVGTIAPEQAGAFNGVGLDHEDVALSEARDGRIEVEGVMTPRTAAELAKQGVELTVKQVRGQDAGDSLRAQAVGQTVFRSYSGPGGIQEELIATVRANPGITELVRIGRSLNGKPILAVRVTKDARRVEDGSRPAVLYNGTQHAREWITPEMTRRLMHHMIDGYATDPEIRGLVDTRELWFVPVANPDGYDFTFTEGNRLWRKNLRDNNGDGQITGGDGVDPNRNWPTHWGYDNEGSSPEPADETFRGTGPASEPETRALDGLAARIGFAFHVNYHSAAELILYGTGFQVNTPTPDDVIHETLAGDDAEPAVPGYDPDLSAELYTTNGETTEHMHEAYDTLAFTPEMSTCQTVSNLDPDDQWVEGDCASVFNFPDDEGLVEDEFRKNVPFALSLARSATDPGDPQSSLDRQAPDFRIDPFAVSHGTTQPVAVTAARDLGALTMRYRVNGGAERTAPTAEWTGGERYGDENDVYYAEFRGSVTGTAAGDSVEVWFTGTKDAAQVASERFTYRVSTDIGGRVLVLAAEDTTGISPAQGKARSQYSSRYLQALTKAGYTSDRYDVDENARTAPHHLGVLSHYDAVVWETGDDVLTREAGQVGGTAAELTLDLELSVRDYLNEGGKLLHTGKYAQFGQAANGAYSYNPFEEEQGECTTPGVYPCLPLGNDFLQYWLGAYEYVDGGGSDAEGIPFAVAGSDDPFDGFAGILNAPGSAGNQDHTASFLTTSSFLPKEQFPLFASDATLEWDRPGGSPFDPRTGENYLYSGRANDAYKRFSREVDLTGATTGSLDFQVSYSLELDWDYLFVEAREVGTEEWTTLPDTNGHTSTDTGLSCPEAVWATIHPQLSKYQGAAPGCEPTGTTGEWHAATGSSGGYQAWSMDLSRFAGKQVEISISTASDPGVQALGVFVDDVSVTVGGAVVAATSFEAEGDLAGFTVPGAPAGSPGNADDWARSQTAFEEGAGITTEDTVLTGFGAEGFNRTQLADFVRRSMTHLLGTP